MSITTDAGPDSGAGSTPGPDTGGAPGTNPEPSPQPTIEQATPEPVGHPAGRPPVGRGPADARRHLVAAAHPMPRSPRYLDRLIDANGAVLVVPGDCDLVFPGQVFALPPVPAA